MTTLEGTTHGPGPSHGPGHGAATDVRARVLAALELVHDPRVQHLKRADPAALSPAAAAELHRQHAAMLRHVWDSLGQAYGIALGKDFCSVHRPGDRLNCLMLTPDKAAALRVQRWWAGPPVAVSEVTAVDEVPEAWVAMGVALHWSPPAWLPAAPPDEKNSS